MSVKYVGMKQKSPNFPKLNCFFFSIYWPVETYFYKAYNKGLVAKDEREGWYVNNPFDDIYCPCSKQ